MLNEEDKKKVLYPIEQSLRNLSESGRGHCYILAVYDICRQDASKFKQIMSDFEEKQAKENKQEESIKA